MLPINTQREREGEGRGTGGRQRSEGGDSVSGPKTKDSLMGRSGQQQMMMINTTDDNETILREAGAQEKRVSFQNVVYCW